ncbi:MAG: RNA polymerase sigma factor SigJ [Parvibaculaceae bacterium]|nr:RNA polymerase sigma factor SigJ [Parvibaculaceae bacterium]
MPTNLASAPFETARPMLMGLAYRMLGSYSDAEDVVQDVAVQWMKADHRTIDVPAAWLTTVCTRKALDVLKSAQRRREEYIGPWLPEPVHTQTPESSLLLAESVTTAFLLVLERLAPKERAAYLLHDVFAMSYKDIAACLESSEAGCRKLISRARANIAKTGTHYSTPLARQNELLAIFQSALETGSVEELAEHLADDVCMTSDGGGKVSALLRTLEGASEVLTFTRHILSSAWPKSELSVAQFNAAQTLIVRRNGLAESSVSFTFNEAGKVNHVFIMRNPEKMTALHQDAAHKPIS